MLFESRVLGHLVRVSEQGLGLGGNGYAGPCISMQILSHILEGTCIAGAHLPCTACCKATCGMPRLSVLFVCEELFSKLLRCSAVSANSNHASDEKICDWGCLHVELT